MENNIIETLEDGREYINRVNSNLFLIINAIERHDNETIAKIYNQLKEGLDWISEVLENIAILTDIDFSQIKVNNQKGEVLIKRYSEYLEILEIMFVQASYDEMKDSLEIELPKFLKKMDGLYKKITQSLLDKMN